MKQTTAQIQRDSELKEKELTSIVEILSANQDFKRYLDKIAELKKSIKDECIKEGDIEVIRGYQAQYALLDSIWKNAQLPEERESGE
jgi:hypothetical protein